MGFQKAVENCVDKGKTPVGNFPFLRENLRFAVENAVYRQFCPESGIFVCRKSTSASEYSKKTPDSDGF